MTITNPLPPLAAEEYDRLRADIAAHGVRQPIEKDTNGVVLDGHHRQAIANELGIECPVREPIPAADTEEETLAYQLRVNLNRRNLSPEQRAEVQSLQADLARRLNEQEWTSERIGDVLGVSRQTIDLWIMRNANVGIAHIDNRIKLTKPAKLEAVERVRNGETQERVAADYNVVQPTISRAIKEVERIEAANARASADPPPPDTITVCSVVYADPPWRYDYSETKARQIENHYPTMTVEDICALEVPAADDSVLLLWATSPKLREALAVVDAWGFEYRTCMVWVKDHIGMGYYARQRHELLLIAGRGALPVPEPSRRPDSVITAPRGKHSAKPPLHDLIDDMWPGLPKVELFARQPLDRPWWTTWGNDRRVA